MRLTTKGRFAVTAMVDLAMNAQNNAVKLNAISERQKISLSYLEQLFSKLRRAGLVESVRGPGGGYVLGKPAGQINIAQIITAAEDRLDATLHHPQPVGKPEPHHPQPFEQRNPRPPHRPRPNAQRTRGNANPYPRLRQPEKRKTNASAPKAA